MLEGRDGVPSERNQDIPDDDASLVRGAFRLDFEDDGCRFFAALQGLAKRIGQAHGLQAHAAIALRDMAFFQKDVYYSDDDGRRLADVAEARKTPRGDAAS